MNSPRQFSDTGNGWAPLAFLVTLALGVCFIVIKWGRDDWLVVREYKWGAAGVEAMWNRPTAG